MSTAGNSQIAKSVRFVTEEREELPAMDWGRCDLWVRCGCGGVRLLAAFVMMGATTTLFCRGGRHHDIPVA
jgi:hypothetical protein